MHAASFTPTLVTLHFEVCITYALILFVSLPCYREPAIYEHYNGDVWACRTCFQSKLVISLYRSMYGGHQYQIENLLFYFVVMLNFVCSHPLQLLAFSIYETVWYIHYLLLLAIEHNWSMSYIYNNIHNTHTMAARSKHRRPPKLRPDAPIHLQQILQKHTSFSIDSENLLFLWLNLTSLVFP